MNLFEGILLTNLVVSLWLVYKLSKLDTDVEILYQGVAGILEDQEELNKT